MEYRIVGFFGGKSTDGLDYHGFTVVTPEWYQIVAKQAYKEKPNFDVTDLDEYELPVKESK